MPFPACTTWLAATIRTTNTPVDEATWSATINRWIPSFFVVGPNNLGSSGPLSINPATGKPYGSDSPMVIVKARVRSQAMLADHFGIKGRQSRQYTDLAMGNRLPRTCASRAGDCLCA